MQPMTSDDTRLDKRRQLLELIDDRLERAIEQLRLANEALQVSNQELCSLTNQLEILNQEAEALSQEVLRLRDGYAHALDHMPYPVMLTDKDGKLEVWNAAAQQLFNLAPDASVGIDLSEIPVQPSIGQALSRKHRAVVERGAPLMLRNQPIHVKRTIHQMDVHFTSLFGDRSRAGILVAFMSSPARDGVVGPREQKETNLVDSAAS
jgi:PAS domain-containing protein